MKKIIVTGHGHYATGLQSAVELFAGKNDDVFYVDFVQEDSDETLKGKLERMIETHQDSEILIFCDLIGGTPYKVAAELAFHDDRLEVVAGCNVGALLDAIFTKEQQGIASLAEHVVEVSKQATGAFVKKLETPTEDLPEDGI
ncbi:PTS sugar transporter subunit IIA [Camelliibacillus cellulosilyticus]|uniref:PTS sugar transporter subunit IIA n=1 Tax=Camelliibacillus cellulosilyticus TaxID=2174486 RepID=A0ABV9GP86_9BACL